MDPHTPWVRVRRPGFRLRLALLVLLSLPSPPDLQAQEARSTGTAAFLGRVTEEETGEPIAEAQVYFPDLGVRSFTDRAGRFQVQRLPPGEHVVLAQAIGYAPLRFVVQLQEGQSMSFSLELSPEPIVLGGVSVEVMRRERPRHPDPRLAGFLDRRSRNQGIFLTRREIEERNPSRFVDLFWGISGVSVKSSPSGIGYVIESNRAAPSLNGNGTQGRCPMSLYLDGQQFEAPENGYDFLNPREIAAIEVYLGASQVPTQFLGRRARCGVIVIWTRGATPL